MIEDLVLRVGGLAHSRCWSRAMKSRKGSNRLTTYNDSISYEMLIMPYREHPLDLELVYLPVT